ncbi:MULTISPECIES: TIGR01458 family HAD-type hydrolase [unclassified Ectothiorhodospira]|uniref:TIGR01458 family HAD-type hydrolase n=1 Tax=unclassified Ectothiorhodospira TaxID=2684909 RepID=UPI001EE8367E|nr:MULTISPECIES: TIGR01458 family HAD-type hydrolase [unclassified Ectothiorhodospira]MCG5516797.1 TIGR01458 family HAD-type hydrolase [Ectothiorhodospira sp. 9100]MCG5519783.1 TIGR01458 family HAD-type hydrolase [Ectothiorhodospira sp. 9905]
MFERAPQGIDSVESLLLDLSGVLYVGDEAVPGAREAVEMARSAGLPLRLITNTTRQPRRRILDRLRTLGFDFPDEALTTAPSAIRAELQRQGRAARFFVHPDLRAEFADCDSAAGDAEVVVLGDMGEHFSVETLNNAFRTLMDGAELWAMGMNRYFQEPTGLSLDLGPFVRALEYAAEVEAKNFGKPDKRLFHAAIAGLELPPERVLMVGDDYAGDIDGARSAGLAACLVRTGKYRAGDEDRVSCSGAGLAESLQNIVQGVLQAD